MIEPAPIVPCDHVCSHSSSHACGYPTNLFPGTESCGPTEFPMTSSTPKLVDRRPRILFTCGQETYWSFGCGEEFSSSDQTFILNVIHQ